MLMGAPIAEAAPCETDAGVGPALMPGSQEGPQACPAGADHLHLTWLLLTSPARDRSRRRIFPGHPAQVAHARRFVQHALAATSRNRRRAAHE